MTQPSPVPAPKARVLCNMRLPEVEGYAIRCFGDYLPPRPPGAPAWRPEMERRNLADILPLIPAAEQPDILVCASPEYLPIPWDIRAFTGPKVLLITDWNMCLRFLPDLCPLFDFCFTDWPGYRLLRRAGVANVFHQPLFGHDPARFRGPDTGISSGPFRNLDVSFCGNLNAGLHGERNRLLARVARWAQGAGRPVHLRQAFGDAYIDILNRSRLVFNYSIRGEANMRLFETMACGAVPLVEETNQEAAILFQEGRHYFRYPLGGLERKLDELLAEPGRIAEVAAEASREVGRHTKARQIGTLLDAVTREGAANPGQASRPGSGGEVPALPTRKALAKIRILGMGYTAQEAIQEIQLRKEELPGLDLEALPGLLFALCQRESGPVVLAARHALEHLLGSRDLPTFLSLFLRMKSAQWQKDWNRSALLAGECLRALEQAEPDSLGPKGILYSLLLPPVDLGQGMNADVNQAFLGDLTGSGPGEGRRLLDQHCRFALAEARLEQGRPDESLREISLLGAAPKASIPRSRLEISAALQAGDARVKALCRAWFDAMPLDTSAWEKIFAAHETIGDAAGWEEFLKAFHDLALYFLDPDQSDRIRRMMKP